MKERQAVDLCGYRIGVLDFGGVTIMSPEGEAGIYPMEKFVDAIDRFVAEHF